MPLLDSLLPSRAQYALGALIRCAAIGRADISESPNRSLVRGGELKLNTLFVFI